MSIYAAPTRGFQDFQRTGPWDSGVLYNDPGTTTAGQVITPALDVSRWAYVAGRDWLTLGTAAASLQWFTDVGEVNLCGQRAFTLVSIGGAAAQYRLPNLGPFLRITWTALGSANMTHNAFLFGTNRYHPLEMIPVNPQLIAGASAAVVNGGTSTVWPVDYYDGPALVTFNAPGANWFITITSEDAIGVGHDVDVRPMNAGRNSYTTTLPAGAWSVTMSNLSGATGTYTLSITPSTTGSS